MANVFVNLPAAAANGAGAWVDVSAMGAEKTIVVGSAVPLFVGTVNIEISNEAAATKGNPVASINGRGRACVKCAALWMRAVVVGYQKGSAPDVEVGANDDSAVALNLPVTAGDGTGASIDTSTLGTVKTITVHGPFRGSVQVEFSQDNSKWAPAYPTLTQPGQITKPFAAQFMRVTRLGVPTITPGLPIVDVGAIVDVTPGGSFVEPVTFLYTATGAEGSDFVVLLPAARANDDYHIFGSMGTVASHLTMNFPDALAGDRTTTQFRVITSAAVTAGDQFMFIVVNP